MSDIVKFIEDRLAEREAEAVRAREAASGPGGDGELWVVTGADNATGVAYDPARELRAIEGQRAIVAECAGNLEVPGGWEYEDTPKLAWFTLCGLAAAWADHPDYDQDWALGDAEEES